MDVSLFDYNLPPELIAQEPIARGASRMLIMSRDGSLPLHDAIFKDLPGYLRPDDCLVLNNTRVIPARLHGKRVTGGKVELLLLREIEPGIWESLARPGARMRPGAKAIFGQDELEAEVVAMGDGGLRTVRLHHSGELLPLLDKLGETPLPPYIHREQELAEDKLRYQTVYAARPGAVAAPTAGLHFNDEILNQIRSMGIRLAEVTLHVGLGTFKPVSVDRLEDHDMHEEWLEVSEATAATVKETKATGGRVIAIGTTSVRALESQATGPGQINSGARLTRLFIYPGYEFKIVDAMLTNFHLPRSTLLMMLSAFAGRENILAAYQHAINQKYRFFSYGDCMFVS